MVSSGLRLTKVRTGILRSLRLSQREEIEGYLYLLPWLLGLVIFYGIPMIASFTLSFTKYDIVRPATFIGLANYKEAFTTDSQFWPSLGRTFYYAGVMVPVSLIGSLLAALLLNQKLWGTKLFRTFFFLPSLTPAVAAAFIWRWLLHPEAGLLNYALWQLHIQGPGWMNDPDWVIPSLMMIALWGTVGGTRMLIFLAGLQGVPQELYEAAEIDGAAAWSKFWHVTLPMISPTFLFNLVLGVIGALQVFTVAYTATNGGPGRASWFFELHIYRNAFEFFYVGYASALGWFLALVIFILTYANFRFSGRWVYYEGDVR
jgi:multiple sugar transport system permease protein